MDVQLGDCRDLSSINSGSIGIVIDKGTLDALEGDADQLAMIDEAARVRRVVCPQPGLKLD